MWGMSHSEATPFMNMLWGNFLVEKSLSNLDQSNAPNLVALVRTIKKHSSPGLGKGRGDRIKS